MIEDEYGDVPATEFGPRALAELRDLFVASGNARQTANEYTLRIKKMFRHAASRELVPLSVFALLDTLDPLAYGQTTAPEYRQRKPVSIAAVRATSTFLSPQAKAIIALLAATGMRPSEIFEMRPGDIDRTGDEWFYRPEHHKTRRAWHRKSGADHRSR